MGIGKRTIITVGVLASLVIFSLAIAGCASEEPQPPLDQVAVQLKWTTKLSSLAFTRPTLRGTTPPKG